MDWKLFKADEKRKKWSIRGTLYNGIDVKIPGHRDKAIAEEMRRNIEKLNRAKANNDMPPPEVLPWLNNLSQDFVELLAKYGLVDRRRLDRHLPVESFLPDFEVYLRGKVRKAHSQHPSVTTGKVRRIFRAIEGLRHLDDLTPLAVQNAVRGMVVLIGLRSGQPFSVKNTREYFAAIKHFCEWMKGQGSTNVNPLDGLRLPSSKNDRVRNRRPLSHDEFAKLMTYLQELDPCDRGRAVWTPNDRAMLYWAAVTTGFRRKELRSLTRGNFNFDVSPATLTVYAEVAKNGCKETVPLPEEFADSIKAYTANHLPNTPVFRTPKDPAGITRALYRDLDAAGVQRKFSNGDLVDFHTFRSTAICWWLLSGLNLLEVQFLARLKTLDLIQEYVRRYVPNYDAIVAKAKRFSFRPFDQRRLG